MKKILLHTILFSTLAISSASFADVGGFLNEAASDTTAVSQAVNGPTKVSVKQLKDSGTKYINKYVQVTGNIIEAKMINKDSYSAILRDKSGNQISIMTKKAPSITIGSSMKVSGTYNGSDIETDSLGNGLL